MRNALPCLICVLVACIYVVAACPDLKPGPNFDVKRVVGKWYLSGFATNQEWFMTTKTYLRRGTIRIVPTAEGDVDFFASNMRISGYCWRLNFRMYKTDTPGQFFFISKIWKNENDLRMVDFDYNKYAMLYAIKTEFGIEEPLIILWSRTKVVPLDVQEKFKQLALDTGILAENTLILQNNGECPDVRTYIDL
ncbi:lipocalin-like [Aulostomus maculatus]